MSRHRLRKLQAEHTVRQIEMSGERGRFDALARRHEDGTAPRAVSSFNLFQTPPELAQRVVDMLPDLPAGAKILEPSAGLGRLYTPLVVRFPSAHVTLVEQSPDCMSELYLLTAYLPATLRQADFLTLDLGPVFDAIVMNPPFKMGRDIKHIRHALQFLKPGGRLVSICANGPRQRAKLKPDAIEWHDLEPGAFKSSGTNVNASIVVLGA
jgi:SAM-dependent methyltransferase